MDVISPYILHPKYSESQGFVENLDPEGADASQASVKNDFCDGDMFSRAHRAYSSGLDIT